jgi:hypothetical protein
MLKSKKTFLNRVKIQSSLTLFLLVLSFFSLNDPITQ